MKSKNKPLSKVFLQRRKKLVLIFIFSLTLLTVALVGTFTRDKLAELSDRQNLKNFEEVMDELKGSLSQLNGGNSFADAKSCSILNGGEFEKGNLWCGISLSSSTAVESTEQLKNVIDHIQVKLKNNKNIKEVYTGKLLYPNLSNGLNTALSPESITNRDSKIGRSSFQLANVRNQVSACGVFYFFNGSFANSNKAKLQIDIDCRLFVRQQYYPCDEDSLTYCQEGKLNPNSYKVTAH